MNIVSFSENNINFVPTPFAIQIGKSMLKMEIIGINL